MTSIARTTLAISLGLTALAALATLPTYAQQPLRVTFWHTYNSDSNENTVLTTKVIPAFEAANPGIKIDAQVVPYGDFRQKLLTSVAGGTPPDLARLDIIWSPEFAKLGALEKVDGYPGFSALKNAVFKGPLSTNVYKSAYYGLPLDTNTQIIVYNDDLLKAAGLNAPPTTIAGFKAYLEKTIRKDGNKTTQYGFSIPGPWNWFTLPWIWSMGGSITNTEATKASGYINGSKTIAAVQTLLDWYKAGLIAPSIAQSGLGSWEGMGAKQYVATQDGPWAYLALKAQYPTLNLKHAPFPSGAGGSVSVVGGENIALFKDSKNKEAAWKFLQYMLSEATQLTMATTGQIPVISSALNDPFIKNHPYYKDYLVQLRTAKARTVIPAYGKLEDIMQGAVQDIFAGKVTVKAGLDDAAVRIDDLLQ